MNFKVYFDKNDPYSVKSWLNSLANDEILDRCKLKACADDKINLNKKSKLALGRVENIVGKGENAGY